MKDKLCKCVKCTCKSCTCTMKKLWMYVNENKMAVGMSAFFILIAISTIFN